MKNDILELLNKVNNHPYLIQNKDRILEIVEQLKKLPVICGDYNSLLIKPNETIHNIYQSTTKEESAYFFLAIFLYLLDRTIKTIESYPDNIKNQFINYIQTVYEQTTKQNYVSSDQMLKDLAFANLHAFPTCLELAVPCYMPRRIFFTFSNHGFYFLIKLLFQTAKIKPLMLQLHMNNRNLREFNYENKVKQYAQLAEILELFPEIKGIFASSWWYDPALKIISPHMAHYLDDAIRTSAIVSQPLSDSTSFIETAIANPKRGALYRKGEYNPKAYTIIWTRHNFIRYWKTSPPHC